MDYPQSRTGRHKPTDDQPSPRLNRREELQRRSQLTLPLAQFADIGFTSAHIRCRINLSLAGIGPGVGNSYAKHHNPKRNNYENNKMGVIWQPRRRCFVKARGRSLPRGDFDHCTLYLGGVVMSWRTQSLEIINSRIRGLTQQTDWGSLPSADKAQQIKLAVDSDYPYSERMGQAYSGWLDARAEIFGQWGIPTKRRKQRPPANRKGWRKPVEIAPGQLNLFEE